jgi:leucine dehydrogenase
MVFCANHGMTAMEFIRIQNDAANLDGLIAIHSTALGPATGGCRLWPYHSLDKLTVDAARLAEGMSYKNALAGLPLGGGTAVLRQPDRPFDRKALFEAFGRAVSRLGGRYVTAEDVGTTLEDMACVATRTCHVAGLPAKANKAVRRSSAWAARGVYEAMQAISELVFGSGLQGLIIGVLGAGNVGAELCRLLAQAGADVRIADIDPTKAVALARRLDVTAMAVNDLLIVPMDIFSPCSLGGVLNPATVKALRARIICGGANGQLSERNVADLIMERGMIYVPDYVVNAGGAINASAEFTGENEDRVLERIQQIGQRAGSIVRSAIAERVSPAAIADRITEGLLRDAAMKSKW